MAYQESADFSRLTVVLVHDFLTRQLNLFRPDGPTPDALVRAPFIAGVMGIGLHLTIDGVVAKGGREKCHGCYGCLALSVSSTSLVN
jgi:hypothetical protein